MNFNNLLIEKKDSIATITINRPDKLNALNLETVGEISCAIKEVDENKGVRVVVITGSGEKSFVAGADIAAMLKMSPDEAEEFAKQGHACMDAIENCSKPVIAAVNGFALGGGTELALACDIIIASDSAKFGLPEVKLGLYPGFGGTQRLPRLIGAMRARELIFSGRTISARDAFEYGIVNRIVPLNELMNEVKKLAAEIMSNGREAVSAAKKVINEGLGLNFQEGLYLEQREFSEIFKNSEHIEGMTAFVEKRKPSF